MNFFNKFKDLFEVPSSFPLPNSKLRIDNQLFIEKSYVNTYSQEYSLNSKLRELKKDYNEFENQISEIEKINKTTVRSISRKGKDKTQKSATSQLHHPQEKRRNQMIERSKTNEENYQSISRENQWKQEKKKIMADSLKRESWLKDEQTNIIKHSEMDHIFSSKLSSNTYNLDRVHDPIIPKIQMSQSYTHSPYSQPKNQAFVIKNRGGSRVHLQQDVPKQPKSSSATTAQARRQQSKANLSQRRLKLQQLLKSMW